MKKLLMSFLGGILLFLPFVVNADITKKIDIPKEAKPVNGKYTVPVKITAKDSTGGKVYLGEETIAITSVESNVTNIECDSIDEEKITVSSTGSMAEGNLKCTFKAVAENTVELADNTQIGQITVTVKDDATDNCGFTFMYEKSKGNVNTGSNVPFVVIGAGVLLAGAIFIVTKNRKIYNI